MVTNLRGPRGGVTFPSAMRASLLLLCALTFLLVSGCKKKSSPEFYRLESDQSILVSRDGDDAWVSPEMAAIVTGLEGIAENAIEKPRALNLIAKIDAEKSRVLAERTEAPRPPPTANPFAGRQFGEPSPQSEPLPDAPADSVDGGLAEVEPWNGMPEPLFVTRYGTCFSPGKPGVLADGGATSTQVVSSSADCQKRFGGGAGSVTTFVFTARGLTEKITETTQQLDAGTLTIPGKPAPPPADPGPPVLTIPGAPVPEGVDANY